MKKLALVFALVLLVVACGDVDESNSTTPPSAAAPETTAAPAADTEESTNGDDPTETADSHEEAGSHEEEVAEDVDEGHTGDPVEESNDHADNDHDDSATTEKDRTVQVSMDEFSYEPGEFEAMAGETVEFVVTNLGVVEHEFRLSNEHRIEEHLASGHADHHDSDDGGHHEDGDVILLVQPGETDSITVTFGEDTTLYSEVACLLPGHYEAGMKAPMSLNI